MTMGKLHVRKNIPNALGAVSIWLTKHNGIGFFEIAYWSFVSLIARLSAHLILAARVLRFFRSSLAAEEFDDEERDEFHELADNLAAYSRSVFHSSRMSALAYSEPNSSTVGGSFSNASFS
ncbi:hypothetical protein [Candidatus Enterovibrio escicola]|uniref:hypothetical protein n=2 Tax=Candidatus Enterovibrio escicola TaxID=1927127 RepID=UPI0012383BBD|nr:hypothetical protein [Candidatus Enterovibrio escacola]